MLYLESSSTQISNPESQHHPMYENQPINTIFAIIYEHILVFPEVVEQNTCPGPARLLSVPPVQR